MIDPKLLSMLRCPLEGGELQIAEDSVLQKVQSAIEQGAARDRIDQRVSDAIEGGLVNSSGRWLYPIRGGIPTLVADEAIRID
jgi:uncharacterized protein YbaR (Trm112 family)